ncbi:hypothetical protein PSCICE_02580 [Pseudomonas cichorii]|nr:hypothetical protein PSCICE_02580 [Pseudomonas cichorii]
MSSGNNHFREWADAIYKHEANLKNGVTPRWEGVRSAQELQMALGTYKLKCFAERIRQNKAATWVRLDPLDALRIHLINKHHWTLAEARQIRDEEDFIFLLHEELLQMRLTDEEAHPVRQWTSHLGSKAEFEQHFGTPPTQDQQTS